MTVRLSDIKYVDTKSHELVCGYLRNIYDESEREEHITPELVLNICLLFYFQREQFEVMIDGHSYKRPTFILSNNKRTASLQRGCYGSLYGNVKIDSLSESICRWDVTLECSESPLDDLTYFIDLGISGDEPDDEYLNVDIGLPNNTFMCRGYHEDSDDDQGFQDGNVFGSKECVKRDVMDTLIWKPGHVVGIKLDLKERNIEYFINDESKGITHQNIPIGEDIKYRLAVTMTCDGHQVTIQSHQHL